METGAGFPERFVPISRTYNARPPRQEKSLVAANCRISLKFGEASAHIWQLGCSRGDRGRPDVLLAEEASGFLESDEDLEARMAHRKAKKKGAGKKKQDGPPRPGGDTVREDGRTLNGINRRTGKRNRRYRRDSGYHLATRSPWRDTLRGECNPGSQEPNKAGRPSYSSISTGPPVSAQKVEHLEEVVAKSMRTVLVRDGAYG